MEAASEKGAGTVEIEKSNGVDGDGAAAKTSDRSARAMIASQVDDLVAAVRRLEQFAAEEAKRVSTKLAPVETKAKENFWVTVLLAVIAGMIFGLFMGSGRRRD